MGSNDKTDVELKFDGDPRILTLLNVQQDFTLSFHDAANKEIGRLWYDEEAEELKFSGQMDASAEVFFNWVKGMFDNYARNRDHEKTG